MKSITVFAILLHFALGGILYATSTTPESEVVTFAHYPNQNAYFTLYKTGADAIIEGKPYSLQGSTVENLPGEFEILEGPTGNYITFNKNTGVTICRIEGRYLVSLPE